MKKVITSIWFLSALIALPILIFMPRLFEKYVAREISKEPISYRLEDARVFYNDLYGDKVKRRVIAGNDEYYGVKRRLVEFSIDRPVFIFHGSPGRVFPKVFFGNVDDDPYREILGFTYAADSMYLNVCKLGTDERSTMPNLKKYFIEFPEDGRPWTGVQSCDFVDLDNNGKDEVIFSLVSHSGNSIRSAVKILDTNNNCIKSSEVIGEQFHNLQFVDVDGDGVKEIFSDGQAVGKSDDPDIPLATDYTYLRFLDINLKFKYAPLGFKKGVTNSAFLSDRSGLSIYTLSNNSLVEEPQSVLYKLSVKGGIIDSLKFDVEKRANICHVETTRKGNILVFTEKGKIHKVNKNLRLIEVIDLGEWGRDVIVAGVYDINDDGIKDIFCYNFKSGDNLIYTEDFSHQVKYGNSLKSIQWLDCKIEKNRFFGQDDTYSYIYSFRKNPYRHLEFPVYLGIYLFIVLLAYFLQKIQESRLKEKYELQNKVRELQLQSLNNQMDPHFIFNTFNTVASVVRQGKSEEAYNLMVQFSKLVRRNMEGAGDINTTLKDELDFIADYLTIQKFRFKNLFNYSILKDKGLDTSVKVPKLLVQIHVENALKHGIRPAKEHGILKIHAKKEQGFIQVSVEDNGVGRSKLKKHKTSGHGIGLRAIKEIIELNNQSSKHKISQEIIDLKDKNGKPNGTRVVLQIST